MAKQSAKKEAQDKINLKPRVLTNEERMKGTRKSVEVRRKRKLMREAANELLSMPLNDGEIADIEKITSLANVNGANITAQEALIYQLLARGIKKGDTKSIELLWRISGQNQNSDGDDSDKVLQFIRGMLND